MADSEKLKQDVGLDIFSWDSYLQMMRCGIVFNVPDQFEMVDYSHAS